VSTFLKTFSVNLSLFYRKLTCPDSVGWNRPGSECYIVFGEGKNEDAVAGFPQLQPQQPQQQQGGANTIDESKSRQAAEAARQAKQAKALAEARGEKQPESSPSAKDEVSEDDGEFSPLFHSRQGRY
jgi:hypothetical protein